MTEVIAGFSQQKLLVLGIDLTEAILLNWFTKFYLAYDSKNKCDAMPKYYFKDNYGNTLSYGWVKNSYVIEQLPVLGITNEKVISRRFDHLVKVGLFTKKVISSQKGKLCLYHLNGEAYNELVTCEERKVKESTPVYNKQKQEESSPQVTQKFHAQVTQESSPQVTQKFHAQVTQESSPQVTQESHAYSDSLVNNSLVNNTAVALADTINSLFGKSAFDKQFIPKATALLINNNINSEKYCIWLKERVARKNPEKPRGLFYRLFFQEDIIQEYCNIQNKKKLEEFECIKKQKIIEAKKIICPICGNHFLPEEGECPECNFSVKDFNNKKLIERYNKLRKLPAEKKAAYEKEYNKLFFDNLDISALKENNYQIHISEVELMLDKKYGLTD